MKRVPGWKGPGLREPLLPTIAAVAVAGPAGSARASLSAVALGPYPRTHSVASSLEKTSRPLPPGPCVFVEDGW